MSRIFPSFTRSTATIRILFCIGAALCLCAGDSLFSQSISAKSPSAASPALRMHRSTDQLVGQSEIIAVGTVESLHSQWNADRTRIFTRVSLSVSEYLKGSGTGKSLTLVNPGGEVGDVGEIYSETSRFREDESVVVFVRRDASGEYRIAGGMDGKYTVVHDESTGKSMISPSLTLDEFVTKVKQVIANQTEK